jgi:hypothetical protein
MVMVSKHDPKTGDAHPIDRWMLGLKRYGTVRRSFANDFQKPLSREQQDLFIDGTPGLHHLLKGRTCFQNI